MPAMTGRSSRATERGFFPGFSDDSGLSTCLPLPLVSKPRSSSGSPRGTSTPGPTPPPGSVTAPEPIRLRGRSTDHRRRHGRGRWRPSRRTDEPLGVLHVRCGNRRASECPSCSRIYAADTFHLIRAGVTGGKGVPEHGRATTRWSSRP